MRTKEFIDAVPLKRARPESESQLHLITIQKRLESHIERHCSMFSVEGKRLRQVLVMELREYEKEVVTLAEERDVAVNLLRSLYQNYKDLDRRTEARRVELAAQVKSMGEQLQTYRLQEEVKELDRQDTERKLRRAWEAEAAEKRLQYCQRLQMETEDRFRKQTEEWRARKEEEFEKLVARASSDQQGRLEAQLAQMQLQQHTLVQRMESALAATSADNDRRAKPRVLSDPQLASSRDEEAGYGERDTGGYHIGRAASSLVSRAAHLVAPTNSELSIGHTTAAKAACRDLSGRSLRVFDETDQSCRRIDSRRTSDSNNNSSHDRRNEASMPSENKQSSLVSQNGIPGRSLLRRVFENSDATSTSEEIATNTRPTIAWSQTTQRVAIPMRSSLRDYLKH